MKREDIEVSDDFILLTTILEEYEITVKKLAMLTGRAASTVYRYCSGEATIPSIVWRVLYKETSDPRIAKLVTGDVAVMMIALEAGAVKLDGATLEKLLVLREKQITCEKYILRILADGVVDDRDRMAIEQYKKAFGQMIQSQTRVFRAVTHQFDMAVRS